MKKIFLCAGLLFALSACDLYEPSWTTPNRMRLTQERFFETFEAGTINASMAHMLMNDYHNKNGQDIAITATYDPANPNSSAQTATREVARVAGLIAHTGVKGAQTKILPVADTSAKVMISYTMLSASAPINCGTMPGFKGDGIRRDEDYGLGCTVETLMARQIAHPQDLLGNKDMPATSDGRRLSNSGDSYTDGVPNEPLEGLSASGDE